MKVTIIGVEAHSSIGLGERYHEPLRSTFRKIINSRPDIEEDLVLSLSLKAMNDTIGPKDFVLSGLVFGKFPQIKNMSEFYVNKHLYRRGRMLKKKL